MVDKPRSQSLKEWSKLTQWNPCIRSSQHGYTWIYSCRHEPGPSNCNSESGLQVEYRVLCKANHWLKTLGSRFSICFDWLVLITYLRIDSNMFRPQPPLTIVAKVLARLLANQPRNSGPLNVQLLVLMCWPCWPVWWVSFAAHLNHLRL